ncbi:hypothetical protein IWQ60_004018 [Tieghemiomyces parasiticus]|uniref:prephenate dehydratase n=1 Tax=Tieghemiomyces parasiticus TaxID=78921 RepID=A0A9W8ABS6_9FUNG|nr:hypothetical protein IWQ60_004018 [Tieghemiomyces parasiticus]
MVDSELRIGFHGVRGALAESAIQSMFTTHATTAFRNKTLVTAPYETIDRLFVALRNSEVDQIMLPVENARSGTLHATMDRLITSRPPVHITGEYVYDEPYCLVAPAGTTLDSITEIHSHPHVLDQCHENLTTLLPSGNSRRVIRVQGESTASCAKRVSDLTRRDHLSRLHHMRLVDPTRAPASPTTVVCAPSSNPGCPDDGHGPYGQQRPGHQHHHHVYGNLPHRAAIASRSAAALYDLQVLIDSVVPEPHSSQTRYVLVAQSPVHPEPHQTPKTSLAITVANRAGSLYKVLACFALRDVNVCKLESRPSRRSTGRSRLSTPWEYTLYLDVDGSATVDEPVRCAINHLREFAERVQVLGSYPRYTPMN